MAPSKKRKSRDPKLSVPVSPSKGSPKTNYNPDCYKKEKPVWQIGRIDNGGKWGWKSIGKKRWEEVILPHLTQMELLTWREIEQQTAGTGKSKHHSICVSKLSKEARQRLKELEREDHDELFSLRLQGKVRVFGNRIDRVFQIFWFDFEHEICLSKKKHT